MIVSLIRTRTRDYCQLHCTGMPAISPRQLRSSILGPRAFMQLARRKGCTLRVMTVFLRFAMKRYNHGARRRDLADHGISAIGCAARRSHGTLAASSAEALVS